MAGIKFEICEEIGVIADSSKGCTKKYLNTLENSLYVMNVMDNIHKQIGLSYPANSNR